MAVYASTEQVNAVMYELWTAIANDPNMGPKLLQSKMIAQFHYREPEGKVTIDCSNGTELKIYTGECDVKPIVEMFMKSDVAHEFWLGKIGIPVAIMTGKIVSKGPVNQALALLPVIKPAFDLYPAIYSRHSAQQVAAK
jgi:SCP-2 sterol transfer family